MNRFSHEVRIYRAGAVQDADGRHLTPGAVAFQGGRVLACGTVDAVHLAVQGRGAQEVRLDHHLILPGLVNAHTHLDLTAVGPQPYSGSFTHWLKNVISLRPRTSQDVRQSVEKGLDLCRSAGSLTVGDICGSAEAWQSLQAGGLRGVGFEEKFGLSGAPAEPWQTELAPDNPAHLIRPGLQPHAPYSSGPALYQNAAAVALRHRAALCTHLSETPEEHQFTAEAAGPFRSFLEDMGRWFPALLADYGNGQSPIRWLDAVLGNLNPPMLLAHINYASEEEIAILARRQWSVAYCPRASHYFGHRNHPYRALMQAGIPVCLGTDSSICHGDQSILEEMRFLHRQGGPDAASLLRMATCSGLQALGLEFSQATFATGSSPGAIAIGYDVRPGRSALDCVLEAATCPRVDVLEWPVAAAHR